MQCSSHVTQTKVMCLLTTSMTAWDTSTLIHTTAKVNFLPLAHT